MLADLEIIASSTKRSKSSLIEMLIADSVKNHKKEVRKSRWGHQPDLKMYFASILSYHLPEELEQLKECWSELDLEIKNINKLIDCR